MKNYTKSIYCLTIFLFMLATCDSTSVEGDECTEQPDPTTNMEKVTINEGIWGNAWFWEGDFMPPCPSGDIEPVEREVYVYELTSRDEADQPDSTPFFKNIETELVEQTTSDESGFFQLQLEPGTYSLFVKEDSLYYANGFKNGNISPITITRDSLTNVQFDITYEATF